MKNRAQYLKLWQKKQSEMRIDDDADRDWQGMHSLLDEHMSEEDGTAKKRGISLFSIMLITLSAAAMLYVGTKVVQKTMQQHARHHLSHHRHRGSGNGIDTTASTDSIINLEDSIVNKTKLSDTAGDIKIAAESSAERSKPNESVAGKAVAAQKARANDAAANARLDNAATNGHTGGSSNSVASVKSRHQTNHNGASIVDPLPGKGPAGQPRNNDMNVSGQPNKPVDQIMLVDQARQSFNVGNWTMSDPVDFKPIVLQTPFIPGIKKPKDKTKEVNARVKAGGNSNSALEWGILIGANTQGSFTPKSQNSNFYGSLPFDAFTGLYGSYDIGEKWGIGMQARVLSPATVKGRYAISTYTHRIDTTNVVTTRYINDSRKVYSVQLPLYATYHVNSTIGLKAGPVFSLPVKQFSTAVIDSANRVLLTGSQYDKKIDMGLSGGITVRYKRLIFEATYLKGLTNHTIAADSMSYKAHTSGTLQFTIGIQLGGKKK